MYSVCAAHGVLAVCFQVFLAHQAQLTITDSHRLARDKQYINSQTHKGYVHLVSQV